MTPSKYSASSLRFNELLVSILVISILVALAVLNFRSLTNNSLRSVILDNFVENVQFAREEAIKREASVVICKSSDGRSCTTSGEWEAGWLVFVDQDNDGILEDIDADGVLAFGVEILKVHTALDESIRFRSATHSIAYGRYGTTYRTSDFTYCDRRGVDYSKSVSIYTTGEQEISDVHYLDSVSMCST